MSAAHAKRIIVALAMRGWLPRQWPTWLISRTRMRHA